MVTTGWQRVRTSMVLAAVALAGACGGVDVDAGDGVGSGGTTSVAPADDSTLVAWCDEVPRPGPIRDSEGIDAGSMPMALTGGLKAYGDQHPETFAGTWLDRAHGGTVVVAFTDDIDAHREAIASLPAASAGDPGVVGVPETTMPGPPMSIPGPSTSIAPDGGQPDPEPPPPTTSPSTTLTGSGQLVDVVQVANSEADLRAIEAQVVPLLGDTELGIMSSSVMVMQNRVELGVREPTDDVRRRLSELLPAGAVCVAGGPMTAPPYELPDTMIPPEGSDPWVSCSGAIAFRRSALDDPPVLEADDPLWVAFEKQKGTAGMTPPELGGDFFLLAREDRRALFASGQPPSRFVSMELEGDRWVWSGSSSGGPCRPRAILPEGLGEADWMLDPAFPAPGPDDTVVHLLVNERSCTGASPIGDRLAEPEVVERGDQILIAVAVEPLPAGSYSCPGNPSQPVEVTLPGPLGGRELADGTFVPPVAGGTGDGF